MDSHSWVKEGDTPLVTYWYDRDEQVSEAVIEAFTASSVEIFDGRVSLHDQVGFDSLDGLDWQSGRALTVSVQLWGHLAIITPETVQIYERPTPPTRTPVDHE